MKKQRILRLAAIAASALLCTVSVPASADAQMTFRTTADANRFTASALAQEDAVVHAAMRIDNYTGITAMKVTLKCDQPLLIENGDFTRDPDRTENDNGEIVNKPSFFAAHGTTSFTRISEETGAPLNVALWYGPGDVLPEAGVVEDPESSFLSCDIRIPRGTPAGVYRFYVSDEDEIMSSGIINPDLYVYDGDGNETTVALQDTALIVEPDALRGDVDCDGKVTVLDSQAALRYYGDVTIAKSTLTEQELSKLLGTPYINAAQTAANVDNSPRVDIKDVMAILRYAADARIGNDPQWDDCIK